MCTLNNPKVDVEAPLIARHHCLENKQSCELLLEVNLVRLDSFLIFERGSNLIEGILGTTGDLLSFTNSQLDCFDGSATTFTGHHSPGCLPVWTGYRFSGNGGYLCGAGEWRIKDERAGRSFNAKTQQGETRPILQKDVS